MTRVLLVNPPSPEQTGSPPLGLQYVAAALLAKGCEVRVIDAAAKYFEGDAASMIGQARAFSPDLIGFSLFTRWVWHAYDLSARLAGSCRLLVAGGAHATVRPDETLDCGFGVAVSGEAELAPANDDLDALPMPFLAQELFDSRWYDPSGATVVPGGMLASRGCPARCTFCANYVTGRKFRFRSRANVIAELSVWHARYGKTFFPFWDDALSADPAQLALLCEAFERDLEFPLRWSAITRANMVTPELLRLMCRAGCVAVNFGVESGDNQILRVIKKGITTEQVVRALRWAKDEGLATAANFMLGFPQETPDTLQRTLDYMHRIAPLVDSFSTLGVAVPFPGTPLYDDHHRAYGFTDWWLREEYSRYTPPPAMADFEQFYRRYIDDANLELNFFAYSHRVCDLIRQCLKFKADHNLRRMGLLRDPVFQPEPAAPLQTA